MTMLHRLPCLGATLLSLTLFPLGIAGCPPPSTADGDDDDATASDDDDATGDDDDAVDDDDSGPYFDCDSDDWFEPNNSIADAATPEELIETMQLNTPPVVGDPAGQIVFGEAAVICPDNPDFYTFETYSAVGAVVRALFWETTNATFESVDATGAVLESAAADSSGNLELTFGPSAAGTQHWVKVDRPDTGTEPLTYTLQIDWTDESE